MILDLSSMTKAIHAMEQVLEKTEDKSFLETVDEVTQKALIAGAIQHFEFTYELCWKHLKRWLEMNLGSVYVDGVSRRELFRLGAEHRLIDDVDLWMIFHRARNLTSYTYNIETAEEVYEISLSFIKESKMLLKHLEERNDTA